ncbi:MAG: M1 family metallopeptidase, partial [Gemmatimonadota bacterium]|nr:M1 family metallopeptidase [Gemmatimonadota bacterium]
AEGRPLEFALGEPDPVLGRALRVEMPPGRARVVVEYETDPQGDGLFWLRPEQTAGGRAPFVFSQGQAILTRSWLPTQDSVGLRQTYEARITVPEGLTAVMSAEHLTPEGVPVHGGRRFDFRMPWPIPTYLIALAAGDIGFRPVGPRTGVFAESAVVESAREEFAELEGMLAAAEAIAGPYRWGRADLLVAPPAFPFGGMENPRLTFVSPTLLAGDRSLTTVVVHELAHAWSGNLVTPATWNDFWLNEGFTVYLELRINEALYGPERAAMLEMYGHHALAGEIERLGPTSPDTRLFLDLAGRDPAVAVTPVPYVKGAAFLRAIEHAVGRERFDAYLRSWFERHAFTSVTTEMFARDLREHLLAGDAELERRVALDRWLYEPGLPDDAPRPTSAALARVEAQAQAFAAGASAQSLEVGGWSPQEWRHFLNVLPRRLSPEQLRGLDRVGGLSDTGNSEIRFAWLRLAVANQYEPALPALEEFLTSQGRGKFVKPLYAALMSSEWGAREARRIYRSARPLYHAAVAADLDAVVR